MATITNRVRDSGIAVKDRSVNILDTYVPPSQRQEYSDSIRSWAAANPKLAAFVAAQLLCSAPPVLLFLAFELTILTTSLLVCVLTALTVAFAVTAFCTGAALLVLLPTLFVTSITGTFLFVSGIVGSAAVYKFSNDPRTEGIRSRAKSNAAAVGDSVKNASNGSIDLNAAAQHAANKVSGSMPQLEQKDANDRAREYLARQSLGIPEKYVDAPNGHGAAYQQGKVDATVDLASGSGVHSPSDSANFSTRDGPYQTGFASNTGKLQMTS